jgi:predicted cation transporter
MLPGDRAVIGIIPAGIVEIVFFFRTIGLAGKVKEKSMIPEALSALGAALIAILIAVLGPVSDFFWYIGCIASLLAVLVTSLGLISKYNILATRPIPTFFDREGGNDSAKD